MLLLDSVGALLWETNSLLFGECLGKYIWIHAGLSILCQLILYGYLLISVGALLWELNLLFGE